MVREICVARRGERLSQFTTETSPEGGVPVQVLCEDHVGTYQLPFLCLWTCDGWANADTRLAVEADVVGWRLPPAVKAGWSARSKRAL